MVETASARVYGRARRTGLFVLSRVARLLSAQHPRMRRLLAPVATLSCAAYCRQHR